MGQQVAVMFRLHELLKKAGMSQGELSRRSDLSMSTVNRIATNKTERVDLATLDKMSEVLGCEPGDLLKREGKRGKRRGQRGG